eukprot:Nitzschia sp. Nitz4//scaffold43_size134323//18578//19801//NITZ4_003280-RA/size134323-augustus-gene-0.231-mRNA-1//-1//CDS//3329551891//2982//frame0
MCCCCCCPPAINALFCLWVRSGFSKGTVAGALTFFPPDPPLYRFERIDENGNVIPDDQESGEDPDEKSKSKKGKNDGNLQDGTYVPTEGEAREKVKSPAQQLTERSKELRIQAKKRNTRDARDAKNKVQYKLLLDPRLNPPRFPETSVEAVKVPTKTGAHVAAIIYRVPKERQTEKTKTLIYSHGNATDIGAMFPLQCILAHSLECNVVSYDYSGYGESGGVPMESSTYTDIQAVFDYTVDNVCDGDESKVILYGQSVGGGPCCYLGCREENLGGVILHSAFMSGMRVLTPSRALACLDIYPNIDRIRHVKCPVLVIHGRLDEEVDVSHGLELYKAIPAEFKREPWWVPDRGHNDITEGPGKLTQYIGRLRNYLASLD